MGLAAAGDGGHVLGTREHGGLTPLRLTGGAAERLRLDIRLVSWAGGWSRRFRSLKRGGRRGRFVRT